MTRFLRNFSLLFLVACLFGCNHDDFASADPAPKKEDAADKIDRDRNGRDSDPEIITYGPQDKLKTASGEDDHSADIDISGGSNQKSAMKTEEELASGSEDAEAESIEITESEKEFLRQKCWFAVSGTWIAEPTANANYDGIFPATTEGDEIAHGRRFDSVGGIFLEARDAPYEFGKGGHEIDDAVNETFDSIAVPAGMRVLIKDDDGNTLFSGAGPLIGWAAYYGTQASWQGYYHSQLQGNSTIPEWMQSYVDNHDDVMVIPLHAATWVKVSTVPGS